jgi:hypothetical protein
MGRGLALNRCAWWALALHSAGHRSSGRMKRLTIGRPCAWLPTAASAHGSVPGMNRLVTGILHPVTEPAMGCFTLLLNVAALWHAMQQRAITTLGVRIVSSWWAASAILMMALGFAGKGQA